MVQSLTRRSGGCTWCRRQKVKCDEGRPACARCFKATRECVYSPRYQFRDENPKFGLATNQKSEQFATAEWVSELRTELNVISTKVHHGGIVQKFQLIRSRSATPRSRKTSPPSITPTPSPNEQDRLATTLIGALVRNTAEGYRLQCLGPFISDIPSRIGQNPALDAAVACLLQCHSQLLRDTHLSPGRGVRSLWESQKLPSSEYMKALRTLQEVIEHPVQGFSTETVCATLVMSYYEMMVADKRGAQYIAHAGAAATLIIQRGPRMIQSTFDKELLRAQRGYLIMQALLRQEDCILLSDGWRDISMEKSGDVDAQLVDRLYRLFCDLPTLTKLARNGSANELLESAEAFREKLASISAQAQVYAQNSEPAFKLAPSTSNDETFPSMLHFSSKDGGIFYTFLWTAHIILDVCMMSSLSDKAKAGQWQRLKMSADAFGRKICMTYEYAASLKPLGAQFIQMPLTCAYFVSTEEVKAWIVEKLNELVVDLHVFYTKEYLDTVSGAILGFAKVSSVDV
ncbi:hypothetical protein H2200_011532 [Cladophialophora chaetospira]|uniref:Zn(2)-C6 fungal-type domain-containing protein n=1 Tax=Cladophialophora chaetospira TaxID=386627 RepID=A0AA39CD78_9EURO|nr:hypothetical protein H2200_011532 [Cladophialophora chaetospira]